MRVHYGIPVVVLLTRLYRANLDSMGFIVPYDVVVIVNRF